MSSIPPPFNPDPMTALENRWYNGLSAGLNLDPNLFQIRQPVLSMPNSDQTLWAYQDVIPPMSLTFNNSVANGNRFSDEYAAVVNQLEFPPDKFRQDIGDEAYQKWSAYLQTIIPPPSESQLPILFRRWSILNAPSVMSIGVSDLSQTVLIRAGQTRLLPYEGPNPKPIDFSGTFDDVLQFLENSPGASLSFDSSATDGDVTNTWTGGDNVGLDGLWTGGGATSRLGRRFASSNVTVALQFKSYAVWTSIPGAWYDSSLLNVAFSNKGNPPWPATPNPSWDELFDQDGSMRRFSAALFVADGINAIVTSDASYSVTDQHVVEQNAANGAWPFYMPSNGSAVTNVVTFDQANRLKIETVTRPGKPIIFGANVLDVARYLGHATGG